MIYYLHGLFGTPDIWSKYIKILGGTALNLDELPSVSLTPADSLIGYSMGGRIALGLAEKSQFNLNKLVLLSTHPGLKDQKQRNQRKRWEDKIILSMKNDSEEVFIKKWNSLEVFTKDRPIGITKENISKSIRLFERYRLSEQPSYHDVLKAHQNKVFYLYGKEDQKYSTIATELANFGIKTQSVSGGHRIFTKAEELVPFFQRLNL